MHVAFAFCLDFHLTDRTGLVVEDAVNGIISGKACGARTLAPTTTNPREALAAAEPDWIVPDLTQYVIFVSAISPSPLTKSSQRVGEMGEE